MPYTAMAGRSLADGEGRDIIDGLSGQGVCSYPRVIFLGPGCELRVSPTRAFFTQDTLSVRYRITRCFLDLFISTPSEGIHDADMVRVIHEAPPLQPTLSGARRAKVGNQGAQQTQKLRQNRGGNEGHEWACTGCVRL